MVATMETYLVRARFAPDVEIEVKPASVSTIMWCPAGTHKISASVNGKPGIIEVTATPETAELLDRRIQEMRAKAAQGTGPLPFLDFDHAGGEASGHPIAAAWQDGERAGVYVTVEWTEEGKSKIRGRSFNYFSPEFLCRDGRVVGVQANCGGLVNIPAFSSISRVTCSAASSPFSYQPTINTKTSMNPADYERYHNSILSKGGARPNLHHVSAASVTETDSSDLLVQARQIARRDGIDEISAALVLARESPEAYDLYRREILARGSR
jgi:hypothetical protein